MPTEATLYDLMLLLSKQAEEERRAKILADVQRAIAAAGGSVERQASWGTRPLAFQIRHQAEAEYHLLQFIGPPSLLDSLGHSLRIDDAVLRFRIIKVLRGTPPAPESPPPIVAPTAVASPVSVLADSDRESEEE
jgi:small subunit ribosomal protein S6